MGKKILSLLFLSIFAFSLTAQNLSLYEKNNFAQIQLTAEKPNRPGNSDKPNRPGKSTSNINGISQ